MLGTAPAHSQAVNFGCTGTTTRDCPDVPVQGIQYGSDANIVNVGDGTPGQTDVNSTTIGIDFSKIGVDGAAGSSSSAFTTAVDTKGTSNTDDDVVYVVDPNGSPTDPLLTDGGSRILVEAGGDLVVEDTSAPLTKSELANLLSAGSAGGGAAAAGVTVNNSALIHTTNASGIIARSKGGNGGNGGVVNIGVASWGKDGGSANDAGAVLVTNDGQITVTGTAADQYGIHAVSQGGKGGDGGGAFSLFSSSAGDGGNGGKANTVDVILEDTSSITTHGDGGHGVFAESLGGVGGAGGKVTAAFAFGESGGDGAVGNTVTVDNAGSISTFGNGAHGIFARSYGAGAGSGSSAGGIYAAGGNGGGDNADGGIVNVTNSGTINTDGIGSYGVYIQSVGGGGGDGGNAGGLFTVGGKAGSGGDGKAVTYTQTATGSVTTTKDKATAILVQSIGGGGGNGGNAVSVSLGAAVAIGGSAGPGGDGGTVTLDVGGTVTTNGEDANAIQAQSIGGGGGNGGLAIAGALSTGAGVSVAIGGKGGQGGDGKAVSVTSTATITTDQDMTGGADRSSGIVAQSIGGGGGNGGLSISATVGASFAASVSLGGGGGPGGNADTVSVDQTGTIVTGGDNSIGIEAQSIGGGGGNGGGSVAVSVGTAGYALGFAMGGAAGVGGTAGEVAVDLHGSIATTGKLSHGILAQSVGGGGGNGGFAVSATAGAMSGNLALGGKGAAGASGNTVTVNTFSDGLTDRTISTSGDGSIGILAQSVGGGGGNGGFAGSLAVGGGGGIGVALGGSGGASSVGGTVNVNNAVAVSTGGDNATGILAQSVGGGGGNGGFSLSAAGGVIGVGVAIGGEGGAGSNGGTVVLGNSGDVSTEGKLAYGLQAQSIGGGGGNGGFALSGALGVSVEDVPGGAAAIAIGGTGGGASDGGLVTVNNTGSIETQGLGSHAIFAQSVGGGGGSGGFAGSVAVTIGTGVALSESVGGTGGGGGNAKAVKVNSTGANTTIVTHEDGADGIHAQSIGGGGGDGGFAFSGAFGFGGETNINLAVAIGGFGSDGGDGGTVDISNVSAITTSGDHANGIFAQSIGGGGGNGGLAASGLMGFAENGVNVGVTVGGFAGDGSTSDGVTITNSGAITTTGFESVGILAQSIGGSGGNGGLALTAQMTGASKTNAAFGVAVGGGGGNGNSAGKVEITNNAGGNITTTGINAHGIEAQSIGGGGGNGGMAVVGQLGVFSGSEQEATKSLNVEVSVGGAGGDGSFGNTVDITNSANIEVMGLAATGIFAQSIGGGGGDGGNVLNALGVITDSQNSADSRNVNLTVAIGGAGGDGSDGGDVTVTNNGSITTHGGSGYGIFAQSVGGGGGIGGRANTVEITVTDKCGIFKVCTGSPSTKNNFSLGATVGGNGGGASDGGDVTVNNSGDIETFGDEFSGIYAQSVGGGGGNGGNGILGSGEILPVPVELAFFPVGAVSFYKDLQVEVGGSAGSSGNGGTVDVTNSKNITTHAAYSDGIFAQSVGGGGGEGGKAVTGFFGALGLGGAGGAAGDGGDVTVSQTGGAKIETFGTASNGIFAQSVGGGGGVAGNVDRALASKTAGTIPSINAGIGLALGRSGGGGGNGGDVSVDVDGQIATHGDSAAGIFAHSVGGGGGLLGRLGNEVAGVGVLSWQVGSAGDAGDAGQVDVTLSGSIMTSGNAAHGIFAQSAGGQGSAGDVNVTLNGQTQILTGSVLQPGDEDRGIGSIGIFAHSAASDNANNGDITIAINSADGVVRGGRTGVVTLDNVDNTEIGVGIWVLDGNNNTITNHGLVTTLDGVDDSYAIFASGSDTTHTGGSETVSNFGTVTGSFDLGAGANKYTNEIGSFLNSGKFAYVGDGNLLLNHGRMSPGGDGNVFTTEVSGKYQQDSNGAYGTDLDLWWTGDTAIPSKEADRINVSGTADLAGIVDLMPLSKGNALPGDHEVVILSADGGVTTQTQTNLSLVAPASAVASYELLYPSNGKDIVLGYHIDFSPDGLNPNQTSFGNQINDIQLAFPRPTNDPNADKNTPISPLVAALFDLPDVPSLQRAYDMLSPGVYVENELATIISNLDFQNTLHSCHSRDGQFRFAREQDCVWARYNHRELDRERTSDNIAFQETTEGFSAGGQTLLDEHWVAGAGFSYEKSTLATDTMAGSDGDRYQGGIVGKGRFGGTVLEAALTGGYADYDTIRNITFPNFSEVARGDQEIGFGSAHIRAGQVFEYGSVYLRPSVDAGITHYVVSSFEEKGAPVGGLSLKGDSQTFYTVEPTLEIGAEFASGSTLFRPYLRGGLTQFLGDESPSIAATLQVVPTGVAPFVIEDKFAKTFAEVATGIDIMMAGNLDFRVDGSWMKSDDVEVFGASGKLQLKF